MIQQSFKNDPKIIPKSSKTHPQIIPKSSQNRPRADPESNPAPPRCKSEGRAPAHWGTSSGGKNRPPKGFLCTKIRSDYTQRPPAVFFSKNGPFCENACFCGKKSPMLPQGSLWRTLGSPGALLELSQGPPGSPRASPGPGCGLGDPNGMWTYLGGVNVTKA